MPRQFVLSACCFLVSGLASASAQTWNSDPALELVARGAARRAADQASGLNDFRARAHGFVFFLAQLGEEGLEEPPQLVKSDQLELEVYWKAPDVSKQRIIGWRDRVDLPTDIRYHRDHLGIVQNGFANRIRLGEGDEVRDVPHPLAPDGPSLYDFALIDSLIIQLPERLVRAVEIAFRPKDFDEPRIVGSMYLDAEGGELIQLRFNFTRNAYLDKSLEDITILLENALWDGTWWLPRRQEIEIRRRASWLDVPARGIIRGRWTIDEYDFNTGLDDQTFLGPEIIAVRQEQRDSFPWFEQLDVAVSQTVGPVAIVEMEAVRERVRGISGGRWLTGLRSSGFAPRSISDVLHFNRVEGFTPGVGYLIRPRAGPVSLRVWLGYGVSDQRAKARFDLEVRGPRSTLALRAGREVRDIGDGQIIAPVVNSLLAQERGLDFGDYVLVERVGLEYSRGIAGAQLGLERVSDVVARAAPASGSFRPNPQLGSGEWVVGALRLGYRRAGVSGRATREARLRIEGGTGEGNEFVRVRAEGRLRQPLGQSELMVAAWGGWGSAGLPPHRTFVLGGRGTLVGEPFRAWGGRSAAWATVELRVPVPFPAVPLGPFASTGRQMIVAPFAAAGWAEQPLPGVPWTATDGIRPVVGVAVEVFHRLLRAEFGWAIRNRAVGITVDVRRELWPIL